MSVLSALTDFTKTARGKAAAAVVAVTAATAPFTAAAEDASIVIRYGKNVSVESIEGWAKSITRTAGKKAVAQPGLDAADCAAVVLDGEEKIRYSRDSIENGNLSNAAKYLANGMDIKKVKLLMREDCSTEVAALTPDQ